MRDKDTGNTQK